MMPRISCLALGGMTIAVLVWVIQSSPPDQPDQSVTPVSWSADIDFGEPAVNWGGLSGLDVPSHDLLGEPLGSLEQEVQRVADQHGWDGPWLGEFVERLSEVNCRVKFSALPAAQRQEMLNLTALFLSSNFSEDLSSNSNEALLTGLGSAEWAQDMRTSLTIAEKAEMSHNDFRRELDIQVRQLLPNVQNWEEALVDDAFDPLFVVLQVSILRAGKRADDVAGLQCVHPPKEQPAKRGPVRIALQ